MEGTEEEEEEEGQCIHGPGEGLQPPTGARSGLLVGPWPDPTGEAFPEQVRGAGHAQGRPNAPLPHGPQPPRGRAVRPPTFIHRAGFAHDGRWLQGCNRVGNAALDLDLDLALADSARRAWGSPLSING